MPRPRLRRTAAPALLISALLAVPAAAHLGDPDYRSVVDEIVPPTRGLTAQVIDHDDAILLVNRSDRPVTVLDDENEPYARVLADGTVQVNADSDFAQEQEQGEGEGGAPASDDEEKPAGMGAVGDGVLLAHAGEDHSGEGEGQSQKGRGRGADDAGGGRRAAGPQWVTLDRSGRFQWHDPRINWREPGLPPQVTDRTEETKIEDWRVPLVVGATSGAIEGTLTWVGEPGAGSSFPTGAVVSIAALVLLGGGAVLLVRRRRADADADADA